MELRTAAIAANILLLCFIAFQLVEDGLPRKTSETLFVALLVAAPLLSLCALLGRETAKHRTEAEDYGEDWTPFRSFTARHTVRETYTKRRR